MLNVGVGRPVNIRCIYQCLFGKVFSFDTSVLNVCCNCGSFCRYVS